jgi:hypothetical protein
VNDRELADTLMSLLSIAPYAKALIQAASAGLNLMH